jgi:type VI protein secretion system component VasF
MFAGWAKVMSSAALHHSQLAALLAQFLRMKQAPARTRITQHTSTAACERASMYDASALVVQWSFSLLTLVELTMLSAADRQRYASLDIAQHRQQVSANGRQGVVRQTNVHVAVCD